jgi:hypothetical protein
MNFATIIYSLLFCKSTIVFKKFSKGIDKVHNRNYNVFKQNERTVKPMCKVIELANRLVKEEEIHWDIAVSSDNGGDRYRIRKVESDEKTAIIVTIATSSFDNIVSLRDQALSELKSQMLRNEVKDVFGK